MKFTYRELTNLRAILKEEIKRCNDEMDEIERKHPGAEREWSVAFDCGVNMPTPEAEAYDNLRDKRLGAQTLLSKIDNGEF